MVPRTRALAWYVTLVTATGCSMLVWFSGWSTLADGTRQSEFWLLAALLLVGEIFPISIPRGGEVDEITASTTFSFALLIACGTPAAVVAQVLASIAADLILRKSMWKVGFNAGQFAISLGAAGLIYHGTGGTSTLDAGTLVPFALAAAAFFGLNTVITDIAVAASVGEGLKAYIVKDLAFQAQATLPLLALAPVVVAAAHESLWLIPLATAPAAAVWWGTRLALENGRLADELRASLEHEQQLNRMKDDFAAVVSHELRTPLTSIQGYIKTMLQLSSELPQDERDSFLEAADRQGDRLRQLIEQLLVVGRLETHVEPLALSSLSMQRLCAEVIDELRGRGSGHTFDVMIATSLPAVKTDEGKVHQILSNLMENALKYAPPGTRVVIEAVPAGDGVVVTVSDEGPGIPDEHHDHIFDRFYQVDQSITRRVGGTGLGLYICLKMAESLGGRLWLARSDGRGSAFSLFLPELPPGFEALASPTDDQSMTARV